MQLSEIVLFFFASNTYNGELKVGPKRYLVSHRPIGIFQPTFFRFNSGTVFSGNLYRASDVGFIFILRKSDPLSLT